MELKLKGKLGVGLARNKPKSKKSFKTRFLKIFGRNKNTCIEVDATSRDVGRQANTDIEGGGIFKAKDDGLQADTNIEKGSISSSSSSLLEVKTDDVIVSTPSKDEAKLHNNKNKRARDEIESTVNTPDISSPKTPIEEGEKSKRVNDICTRSGSGSGSGFWSGSGSRSGSGSGSWSGISVADVSRGICSPVGNRKRPKTTGKGMAETVTKKRKNRDD